MFAWLARARKEARSADLEFPLPDVNGGSVQDLRQLIATSQTRQL
jgi:hypothetical protein